MSVSLFVVLILRCISMSKFIKLCILNMYNFLHTKYTSVKLQNKLLQQCENLWTYNQCVLVRMGNWSAICHSKSVWWSWNVLGGLVVVLGISCLHLLMLLVCHSVEKRKQLGF